MPAVEQTLTILPQPRSAIEGGGRAHRPQGCHHVELVLGVPILIGNVVEVAPLGGAGVVDEHVHVAEMLVGGRHHPLAGHLIGHVQNQRLGASTGFGTLGYGLLAPRRQPLLVAADEQDVRALGAEQPRGLLPYPAAGAGDDAGSPFQSEVHAATRLR